MHVDMLICREQGILKKEKKSLRDEKKEAMAELNMLLLTAVGLQSDALTIELLDLDGSSCPNLQLYRWSQISVNSKWLAISCSRHVGQSECRQACRHVDMQGTSYVGM